ncbi:MAG: hypothetical protein KHY89_01555 [Butyricicoccus pullicaecorum]|nr:hypothetical protein [Butyricicoccus pullicaecorum]
MIKASRDSAAYQLDAASSPDQLDTSRFAQPEKSDVQQQQSKPEGRQPASKQKQTAGRHHKKTKKGTQIRQRIQLVTPARLFCAVFVGILCTCLIYSQMMLTVKTHELSQCESELKVLESAHVSLMSKYEQQYNADYIAEYAENTLGMVKLSTSQIEYIELARQEGIDVTSSAPTTGGVVGSLVRGFTALLEYLR